MTYSDPRDPNFDRNMRTGDIEVSGSTPLIVGSIAVLALIFGLAFYFNEGKMTNEASNIQRNAPASTSGSGAAR